MQSEWFISAALLVAAALPFLYYRKLLGPTWLAFSIISLVLSLAATVVGQNKHKRSDRQRTAAAQMAPTEGRPGGYVSSDQCRSCHPSQYESWHRTFHRTMTRYPARDTVHADFKNVRLQDDEYSFSLSQAKDEFWIESAQLKEPMTVVRKRVTLLTGSHHMQAFWLQRTNGNEQALFPFVYLLNDKRWVPFAASFLRDPRLPAVDQTWNANCINCHAVAGQPRLNTPPQSTDTRVAELGIACESCHGPAANHVAANRNPFRRAAFARGAEADDTIVNPSRQSSERSSQICGQCHGIKWIKDARDWAVHGSRYQPGEDLDETAPIVRPRILEDQPWVQTALKNYPTFLSERFWPDGIVRVVGREYNGLLESGCHQRGHLSCLSCHAMHRGDSDDQLKPELSGNRSCLQCHAAHENSGHSHHTAGSSGSLCYNCHMPHTTYGLLKAVRNHYIDSPNAASSHRTERPAACNLCHLDKTLAWTAEHLENWYGIKRPALSVDETKTADSLLHLLRGDAGRRALVAWAMGWPPARKISGEDWLTPYLGIQLGDPYPAVRYIAARSLKQATDFRDLPYDFMGPATNRLQGSEKILLRWEADSRPSRVDRSTLLLLENGKLDRARIRALLLERDNRSMDLQE